MTSKEKRIINSLAPKDWNKNKEQAKQNEAFILPNVSGDHSKSIVRDTPTQDLSIANKKYVDDNSGGFPEGTAVKSTGETGGSKFLREDGDNSCSWQAVSAHTPEGTAVLSTGEGGGTKFLREDGDGSCSWQADNNTTNHTALSNIGSNSHAQIDTHIADTSGDPHAIAADTLTLTNKTIDANGTGNSLSNVDVADLANGTDGELITWDANASPTTIAVGTATHVLTSNGAGAAPTFQAAAGGSGIFVLEKEGTTTVTSDGTEAELDTVDITGLGANDLIIVEGHCRQGVSAGTGLVKVRISDGSNTKDITIFSSSSGLAGTYRVVCGQRDNSNTSIDEGHVFSASTASTNAGSQTSGFNANWITGTVTVSIRGNSPAAGSLAETHKIMTLKS